MARLNRLGLLAGVSWLALAGIAEAATAFGGSIGGALLLTGKQLVVGVALSLIGKAFVKDPEVKKAVHGVQGQVTVGGRDANARHPRALRHAGAPWCIPPPGARWTKPRMLT